MGMRVDENAGRAPFLAKFGTIRPEGVPLPGRYDAAQSLWVVDTPNGVVPLVDAGHRLMELETKTKVDSEQDDSADHVLDLVGTTETRVGGEQDDNSMLTLLTVTITDVKTEADDLA